MNDDEVFELLGSVLPPELITNYVLICETYDEHGAELHVLTSENTTPWLATGMVESALDIIQMGNVQPAGLYTDDDEDDI